MKINHQAKLKKAEAVAEVPNFGKFDYIWEFGYRNRREILLINLLLNWLILSVSVFIVTKLMSSVYIKNFRTALVVALVYGLLKLLLTRVLIILSLPLMILTLGLFYFIINAFLLWLTDKLVEGFKIKGVFSTIIASILISIIDIVLHWVIEFSSLPKIGGIL